MRFLRRLQFAFEKIPYVWLMHGIIILVRNGPDFSLGCFCDNKTDQFPALDKLMLAHDRCPIRRFAAITCVDACQGNRGVGPLCPFRRISRRTADRKQLETASTQCSGCDRLVYHCTSGCCRSPFLPEPLVWLSTMISAEVCYPARPAGCDPET